jgi:hypothetical protein
MSNLNFTTMKKSKIILFAVMLMPGFSAIAQPKALNDEYPQESGHLRFKSYQVSLGNINNTETRTDTLKMISTFSQPMTFAFAKLPEYITCKAVPATLKPNQKGYLLITYDAAKRNDFGQIYDHFTFETNDSVQPEKQVNLMANIMEDFSKWTPEQLAKAAKINFETSTFDFGTINQGDKIEHDFAFSNTGKSDLIIRKTRGSCGCTVGTPEKSTLKPGESSKIHVTFNSAGKSGQQSKTVTITCNDPANSSAVITLTGKVEVKTDPGTQQQTPTH